MICKSIEYRNYRNIEAGKIEFSSGTTILYGKNAQGKTNIIEGVYMFAQGKSHRARVEEELIKFGAESSSMTLSYRSGGYDSTLSFELCRGRRKTPYKNGVRLDRMSEL